MHHGRCGQPALWGRRGNRGGRSGGRPDWSAGGWLGRPGRGVPLPLGAAGLAAPEGAARLGLAGLVPGAGAPRRGGGAGRVVAGGRAGARVDAGPATDRPAADRVVGVTVGGAPPPRAASHTSTSTAAASVRPTRASPCRARPAPAPPEVPSASPSWGDPDPRPGAESGARVGCVALVGSVAGCSGSLPSSSQIGRWVSLWRVQTRHRWTCARTSRSSTRACLAA